MKNKNKNQSRNKENKHLLINNTFRVTQGNKLSSNSKYLGI